MRGEKVLQSSMSHSCAGSPPHARGKGAMWTIDGTETGITPACAGKRLEKALKIKGFDPFCVKFHSVSHRPETS